VNNSPTCKICDAPFTAHHLEEDHHLILNKATPDIVKSLMDNASGVAHCSACDLTFPNTIVAFIHVALHRHTINCTQCELFHGLQETDTISNLQHLLHHPIICPEPDCNGGLFGNITLLLYHIATTHPGQESITRYTSDRQALNRLLRQFLNVPTAHASTFTYSTFFRNPTEEKEYFTSASLKKHPISTMSDVLATLHRQLSQMSVLRKKAFRALQILNTILADNIRSSVLHTVEEEDLLSNATRSQELQEEDNDKNFAEKTYVLLSCHAFTGLEGPDIENYIRDDQEFTDRDLTGAALTASGRVIPVSVSTFFSLNEVIEKTVAAQHLLLEVLMYKKKQQQNKKLYIYMFVFFYLPLPVDVLPCRS